MTGNHMFFYDLSRCKAFTVTVFAAGAITLSGCSGSPEESGVTASQNDAAGTAIAKQETADPETENSADVTEPPFVELPIQAVCDGLHTPAGLTIQPGTGHVFVSTAKGILRLDPEKEYAAVEEIIGFENDMYGAGPTYHLGPLGIGFVDEETLVVGGGGLPDGQDVVRCYKAGKTSLAEPMSVDQTEHVIGPIPKGKHSHRGEGNYFGLTIHNKSVYLTSHGDDSKGWLSRVEFGADGPGNLEPLIAVKKATYLDGPSGVSVLPDGKLVVSQTGELHEHPDAVLAVFDLATGELQRKISTGLFDITAILIHPSSGRLYALDFAWALPEEGGLYSIDIAEETPIVTKHAVLTHPTAMAVAANGDLIVGCVEHQDEQTEGRGRIYIVSMD